MTMVSVLSSHSVTSWALRNTTQNHGIVTSRVESTSQMVCLTRGYSSRYSRPHKERELEKKGLESFAQEVSQGAHSWGVGDSTPLLCSTCREVARSLMGWQGDAGKHPGLGDHRPWSPLLRPTSGKLEHLVFQRLVTQVYVEWLL